MSTEVVSSGKRRGVTLRALFVIIVVALGGAVGLGVIPHLRRGQVLAETEAQKARPPLVRVTAVAPAKPHLEVVLPGQATPFLSTPVYAKTTAYVQRNHVDLGDRVKRGQLLAELIAPENDEAVRVAEARVAEAQANVEIARRTAERNAQLATVGVVPRERADDTQAQANSAVAALRSTQAELGRLSALRGYQRLVAPFDGVVVKRSADPGALVGAATAGGVPLFEIAQTTTLRVFVDVPQAWVDDVGLETVAEVYQPATPTRVAKGKVVRQSSALDPSTRTLRSEIHIGGGQGILPGAFVYVRFSVERKQPPLVVPAAAMVVGKEGTLVARLDGETLRMAPVAVGRDFGKELEVLTGLRAGDRVVLNPADTLADGMTVRVATDGPR